jgi:hypothetical protein
MRVNGTSLLASGVMLAILSGCSGSNIAGLAGGGATGPAAMGMGSSSGRSALPNLFLPGMPTHGTRVAVHPFINFAAMAKNKGNTIAISDTQNEVVDLFTAAGVQVGQLTGFDSPLGMTSDVKGDLYVADGQGSRVQVFAAGFASPPTTLADPGQQPIDVDSFSKGSYVAVVSETTTGGGAGSVSIFKGSTLQSTIALANIQYALSCAFDATGNLYVGGVTSAESAVVGEIPNATSGGTTFEPLTTANGLVYPSGIQVTTAGQIAILDGGTNIYTYNPPSGGSFGTPIQTTSLGGGLEFAYLFAFTKSMADLYVADDDTPNAFEYAYPAGGTPLSTINVGGQPFGVAVIPTQIPTNTSR